MAKKLFLILLACACCAQYANAGRVKDRHYKFKMILPVTMVEVPDSGRINGTVYYDTSADIILMTSGRESKFRSVTDYIDCSIDGLEQQLKKDYGDTSLQLITCSKSGYYPKKTNVLHFRVSTLPFGYNTLMIYFIHHRNKDIQLSFTYKQTKEQPSLQYIDRIMQTLKLR